MQTSQVFCLILGLASLSATMAHPPHFGGGHHHHHDPCSSGHDGFTWAASEGQQLDHDAMQAMPISFVQYGWRVYTNKVCSYKGLEAACPTLQHYEDHKNLNEFFWDIRFPGPKPDGSGCTSNSGCCSSNCANNVCCAIGKGAIGANCTATGSIGCCSGNCKDNKCCAFGKLGLTAACVRGDRCCSGVCTGNVCV